MREYSGITLGLVDVLSKSRILQFENLAKKKVLAIAKVKITDQVGIDINALLGVIFNIIS
jgi:hypothetical protein